MWLDGIHRNRKLFPLPTGYLHEHGRSVLSQQNQRNIGEVVSASVYVTDAHRRRHTDARDHPAGGAVQLSQAVVFSEQFSPSTPSTGTGIILQRGQVAAGSPCTTPSRSGLTRALNSMGNNTTSGLRRRIEFMPI